MKKHLREILVIASIIVIFVLFFIYRAKQMENKIQDSYTSISDVDLTALPDGIYEGSFGDFLVSVNLRVTLSDHRIQNIEIIEQSGGKGYEAHETLGKIKQAQSPKVDAVSGATVSSKCIMVAVYNALTK